MAESLLERLARRKAAIEAGDPTGGNPGENEAEVRKVAAPASVSAPKTPKERLEQTRKKRKAEKQKQADDQGLIETIVTAIKRSL